MCGLTIILSGHHQIQTTKKKKNQRHSVSLEFLCDRKLLYIFLALGNPLLFDVVINHSSATLLHKCKQMSKYAHHVATISFKIITYNRTDVSCRNGKHVLPLRDNSVIKLHTTTFFVNIRNADTDNE